jgi:hypothetical protein
VRKIRLSGCRSSRIPADWARDSGNALTRHFVFQAGGSGLSLNLPGWEAALADVEIAGAGHALHWPQLDADFTVPGLLMGVFGTRAWMASEFARRAGQAKSPAKAAAARANGRKGGRPRRKAA